MSPKTKELQEQRADAQAYFNVNAKSAADHLVLKYPHLEVSMSDDDMWKLPIDEFYALKLIKAAHRLESVTTEMLHSMAADRETEPKNLFP